MLSEHAAKTVSRDAANSHLTDQTAQAPPMPPTPAESHSFFLPSYDLTTRPAYGEIVDPNPAVLAENSAVPAILVTNMASG